MNHQADPQSLELPDPQSHEQKKQLCQALSYGVICYRVIYTTTHTIVTIYLGFPGGASGKESIGDIKDVGSIPGVRKLPWRRAWRSTPVFLPKNPMDRGAWQATVHRVTKSWTQLKQLSMHAYSYIYYILYIYICIYASILYWKQNKALKTLCIKEF